MDISAVILAAGKGTRMKSDHPKCAHNVIDKPMIEYVVDSLNELKVKNIVAIVGYGKETIMDLLKDRVTYVVQEEQLGTAHAVLQARSILEGKSGITIIAIGDMPFIRKETFYSLVINHLQERSDVTVLSVDHPQPYGYGRIVRDDEGSVVAIVEERDCTKDQTSITEINSSVYAVNNDILFSCLDEVNNKNNQKEYYLTDIVGICRNKGLKVSAYKARDYKELSGINNKLQLMEMEEEYQKAIIKNHLLNGVSIHNQETVVIGKEVIIEGGAEIFANSILTGSTKVEKFATVGPNSHVHNSIVKKGANVFASFLVGVTVGENEKVGPFAHLKKE